MFEQIVLLQLLLSQSHRIEQDFIYYTSGTQLETMGNEWEHYKYSANNNSDDEDAATTVRIYCTILRLCLPTKPLQRLKEIRFQNMSINHRQCYPQTTPTLMLNKNKNNNNYWIEPISRSDKSLAKTVVERIGDCLHHGYGRIYQQQQDIPNSVPSSSFARKAV